ncbi:Retron-type RNA-directed DNA polymerase [hydrothermal vent metagenome]|uniref:Retron-type RNA-directed DNA polymerase n=1 Tax=hydrothermal vent metagenome TaxID=652676 RepID=A0A1W1DXT1_9ZZZZ
MTGSKLKIPPLPELTGVVITLKFLSSAQFNPSHASAIDAFIRYILNINTTYTQHFSILTPENGRKHYHQDDHYRFVILALGDKNTLNPLWHKLISTLGQLPFSAPIKDKKAPLRDNVSLFSLLDYFDGKPLSNEKSLSVYTLSRAKQQASAWFDALNLTTNTATLQWRWHSGIRLLRENHQTLKGEQRFCREHTHLTPYLLLKRLYETLVNIAAEFTHPLTTADTQSSLLFLQQQAQLIQLENVDVFWIDTPYFDKHKSPHTLGAMVGYFEIKCHPGIHPDTLNLLITGQNIGFGQRRVLGLGKYRLEHGLKQTHLLLGKQAIFVSRAQSFLTQSNSQHTINKAITLLEQKDNITTLTQKTKKKIQQSSQQLLTGSYQTPVLRGFEIDKKDHTKRLLAVSPLYDRVLQKAVALTLTPGLNAIMSQCSYAYRKGLSRQQVRYEIQNAYRQGYRWVYESDIEDFFDNVDRKQLINRLIAVFGQDLLWQQLENWLGQDIIYKNMRIKRPKGLPQGSPISPLLANFILDDFDSDLETLGFKVIRFADDFIVLCKSEFEAKKAAKAIKTSLLDLNLTLNKNKTHVVSLEQGFQFLGYLFTQDHAIEIGGKTADGKKTFGAKDKPKNLTPWLQNLGEKSAQTLPDDEKPKHEIGRMQTQGIHIIVAGDRQILTTANHHLVVKKDEIITQTTSWEQIHAITLIGLHHITTPAQHQALIQKIPIHFVDKIGQYLGVLTSFTPAQNSYKNWFIQLQMSDNEQYALNFAKQIVISKIHNQRQTLLRRRTHRQELQSSINRLKQLKAKVTQATTLASLNGYEGLASKYYFTQLNHLLPNWAHFDKRSKRPPKDAFNVLLSLGYTILYTHTDSILQSAGLMTWKGIYHQKSPAHAALASDIMESYRHIIERNAIVQINQNSIKPEDFRIEHSANQPSLIRMSAESRRRYVVSIIKRFQKFSTTQTLHQHLYQQAQALTHSMHNQTTFKPWTESK